MEAIDSYLPYVLQGCIFYAFGLKWCYEYARQWTIPEQREEREVTKIVRLTRNCSKFLTSHPLEGTLKLVATAIGLAGTLTTGMPNSGVVSPKVVHATIYLFFAFSGLVDVLNFYFPYNIGDGLVKMALAQSFFVEGFLFIWTNIGENFVVNVFLAAVVWTTSFAVILELVWPETKLLRATTTLLHGGWTAHMIRVYNFGPGEIGQVALAFSWHVAAAFAVTLCVVAVTRSCTPRMVLAQPPEIPIYDYCQESDGRV